MLVVKQDTPRRRAERAALIDAERDRRIASGITAWGKKIQTRPGDLERLFRAIAMRASVEWICADNTTLELDADRLFSLGEGVRAWEDAHMRAARALKDDTAADYLADEHWPIDGQA